MSSRKFSFKPGIPKRYLLILSGLAWSFAGVLLLIKGFISIRFYSISHFMIIFLIGIIGGMLFYIIVFERISSKHTARIFKMKIHNPCLFSFFSFRNYLLMLLMITSGILIKRSGLLSGESLYTFYFMMGIPLLLSAIKFYYYWIYYHRILQRFSDQE
ncbi:hypothetical protein ACFLRZ_00670 [Bacteroidota bacterium]